MSANDPHTAELESSGCDAQAVADFAARNLADLARPLALSPGRVLYRLAPGWTERVIDHEAFGPAPRRVRGTVAVYDAESFVGALDHFGGSAAPVLYADEAAATLIAVLNDDAGGDPGWRDHRVALTLRRTEAWTRWIAGQGVGAQDAFVARLEKGLAEITVPPASEVLEVVRRFETIIKARWETRVDHVSGAQALHYEETVETKGRGGGGVVQIPETFAIVVRPFYGAPPAEVICRVKTRPRDGTLQIGYSIESPPVTEVERVAFEAVVAEVLEAAVATTAVILRGPAPGTYQPLS